MSKISPAWQDSAVLVSVFDQLSDALVLYGPDHVVTGINASAERLFGMTADEIVGRDCRELFHCTNCEPDCGMQNGLGALNTSNGTVRLHLPNGLERIVVIRTARVGMEGVVVTIKDVSAEVEPQRREIVAESAVMRDLMNFIRRVAISEATTIMIEGENGVGKDLIAKTLHYQSTRQAEPFIAINCAAIPETLLESELFGYEKGAFTDARAQKKGIFELADKGTLFLDEIGEIPLILQAKLLRVLEEQCFRRLGGLKDIQLDLRVIAATNKNLKEAVREGAFRQDLYYRLNVIHVNIPPLRERPEDIGPMAQFFLEHYNRKFKRQMQGVSAEAVRLMIGYDWPGNVRELRNAMERAMILEDTSYITAASLPMTISSAANAVPPPLMSAAAAPGVDEAMSLEDNERRLLLSALEKTHGNQTQAARLLRITRDTLRYKMKKFDLR